MHIHRRTNRHAHTHRHTHTPTPTPYRMYWTHRLVNFVRVLLLTLTLVWPWLGDSRCDSRACFLNSEQLIQSHPSPNTPDSEGSPLPGTLWVREVSIVDRRGVRAARAARAARLGEAFGASGTLHRPITVPFSLFPVGLVCLRSQSTLRTGLNEMYHHPVHLYDVRLVVPLVQCVHPLQPVYLLDPA